MRMSTFTSPRQNEEIRATAMNKELINEKEVRSSVTEIVIGEFSMLATADNLIKLVEKRLEALSNYNFSNSKRI